MQRLKERDEFLSKEIEDTKALLQDQLKLRREVVESLKTTFLDEFEQTVIELRN